jgi:archaellin
MKRFKIAAIAIVTATIISASIISELWMGGYLWQKEPVIKKEPPPKPWVSLKILDITGDRSSVPPAATINRVTFLATIYAGNPGINIAHLRIHWMGPTQNVVLDLNKNSPTVASATNFACDEVPVKSPRSSSWDPGAKPPTFFLVEGQVIYITIDLTPLNGINDTLGAGKTASVYFEGVPGLAAYESFTTPLSYGSNRYIDLTMQ